MEYINCTLFIIKFLNCNRNSKKSTLNLFENKLQNGYADLHLLIFFDDIIAEK